MVVVVVVVEVVKLKLKLKLYKVYLQNIYIHALQKARERGRGVYPIWLIFY